MNVDTLLAATYGGDTRAFESLVRCQAARLHRLAAGVTGDPTLADDVLQETFLRVLRVPPAARPSRGAAAWLARVTVRVALNTLESERTRRRREEHYATERSRETAMHHRTPDQMALPGELDQQVAEALTALSPQTRAALWLHVVEGEGVREVAACLESSRSAVSRRIRAGLDSLRARLGASGAALTGTSALARTLRGADIPAPEFLVQRIVKAGSTAIAAASTAARKPDALDVALAAPVRSLPSLAGIGTAVVLTVFLGVIAALWARHLLRPDVERTETPAGPVALAPITPPASAGPSPQEAVQASEAVATPPAPRPATLAGTVRDEAGAPVALADVYLAWTPSRDEDFLVALGSFFRADYFRSARVRAVKTDGEGRYRKLTHDTPCSLDDTGRARIALYYPVAELWYEASAQRGGPTVETGRHAGGPGTVLAEELLVLPRTCALKARLLDAAGQPHKERWAHLHVVHEDGFTQNFTSRTDAEGLLSDTGRVKAAACLVELRSASARVLWTSRRLDGSAGQALELGDIVLDWKED